MAILVDLKDPRIENVTVTFVEVSADMRLARVHVSVMGDETRQKLSLAGLKNSSGYLQKKIGDRLDTRYTPRLEFVLDQGVKNALRVTEILRQVLPPADPSPLDHDPESDGEPDLPTADQPGPVDVDNAAPSGS